LRHKLAVTSHRSPLVSSHLNHHHITMSPAMSPTDLKPLLDYPLKLCAATTATTYVLSIITGNVSQVDRVWTFMPTLYTAYWALLPLWPSYDNKGWRLLAPYVPEEGTYFARDFSPRALLMLGLTVRIITPDWLQVTFADCVERSCGR